MLKISFLEGYAGLRLKDNKPVELKSGVNLIIGKNGSGKSNLAFLIKYIFNNAYQSNKRPFESTFLEKLKNSAICNYKRREKDGLEKNAPILDNVEPGDFGTNTFCRFSFNDKAGQLNLRINQLYDLNGFSQFISTVRFNHESVATTVTQQLSISEIIAKIDLNNDDIALNRAFDLFVSSSGNSSNPVVSSIINSFNSFFQKRFQKFKESDGELLEEVEKLKNSVIAKYNNFFEQTSKTVHITLDPEQYNNKALVLKEGKSVIDFESLSDGEKNLFNLIINLTTARTTSPIFIYLDEPEIFMHDDMIKTLVNEINSLSADLPNTCILIATHSSVLIEQLAKSEKGKLNLISIVDKVVSNSSEDIDFINVLHDNGVAFSPLYISKKPNLFIENCNEKSKIHRQFYLEFFDHAKTPNIISIGSSSQVKSYKTYSSIIGEIVKTQTSEKTIGILDGDMYLINELKLYINGELSLQDLIIKLKSIHAFYIKPSDFITTKTCYFNCWEIENLYILNEIIPFWKANGTSKQLTYAIYLDIIKLEKENIIKSWLKTYKRSIVPTLYYRDQNAEKYRESFERNIEILIEMEKNSDLISQKMNSLFDDILKNELLNWLPGKEVYTQLKQKFSLEVSSINFNSLSITKEIRDIIN